MTVEKIHRFNLFPAGLTPEGRKNILGAQGQLWTELMPRTDDVEYQAFPRACAIAELTWTSPERRAETEGFMARLADHGARLTALGLKTFLLRLACLSLASVGGARINGKRVFHGRLTERLFSNEGMKWRFECNGWFPKPEIGSVSGPATGG